MIRPIIFILMTAVLTACTSAPTVEHQVTGQTRPAVSPADVLFIQHAPEQFQEIGIVSAQSHKSSTSLDESVTDALIELLKAEAAALGANAVVMTYLGDESETVRVNFYDGTQGGARDEIRIQRHIQGLAIYVE
ncbi:hypothetical protein [Aliidiomarina haloalkalitolerans]|nr:hypothetical protein [Aliidiomarina haloalkalitolerans]